MADAFVESVLCEGDTAATLTIAEFVVEINASFADETIRDTVFIRKGAGLSFRFLVKPLFVGCPFITTDRRSIAAYYSIHIGGFSSVIRSN